MDRGLERSRGSCWPKTQDLLVGMETRVSDVVSCMEVGMDDVLRMIGITGKGGAGKTTVARAVFDRLSYDFEATSFVTNVSKVSKGSVFGLKNLLEQVVSDLLHENVILNSVTDGKNMLKLSLRGKKVLLVLDGVDHIEQLEALAGDPEWFEPGSRILIATRDERVLVAHRVNVIHDIALLSKQEAITLFNRYAFPSQYPLPGYEELSEKFVSDAAGLPLTLRAWGAFLCGKNKREWVDAIHRLNIRNPFQDTRARRVSPESHSINFDFDEKLVGMETRVRDVVPYINMRFDKARMLGIKGMGMAGKLQKLRSKAKSFVRNVRAIPKPSMFGLMMFGIMPILMVFLSFFYPMAASYNSSSASNILVSTSTSSIQKRFEYDVFLSFTGEDTRKTFVGHLHHALLDKGIVTYKDDVDIKKGEHIDGALMKAIEKSRIHIIVHSTNYASSSWCLGELFKIMECHKMTGYTAYSVFYDVEPTEVRKQTGAVGKALAKHEKEVRNQSWLVKIFFFMNKKKAMLKKGKWALKESAGLAGWELKNTLDGHEAKLINEIVHEISLKLRSISSGFDEKLVGMETRVRDVILSLEIGVDEVRMIGIRGMGGAGKTTTVRAVFDHLSNHFEAKSFVMNVRDVSKASIFGLKKLQEQVLSNVLNQQVTLDSVDDGIN